MYDVTVVGGGVIGGAVLRELAKFNLSIALVESGADVAEGASKANSGIVHAGFDAQLKSLKAKFNLLGSALMPKVCAQLGVQYLKNGSLVIAKGKEEEADLKRLFERGIKNGVKELSLISGNEAYGLEPKLSDGVTLALHAKSGAIVCPYRLTIAYVGNAMDNGAQLYTNFNVVSAQKKGENYVLIAKDGRTVNTRLVVNCAGESAESIANLFGDYTFNIKARKGEYILLDKSAGNFVRNTIFSLPTKAGKGVLVSPTVDGNLIVGPTSEKEENFDKSVTEQGFSKIKEGGAKICKNIPYSQTITYFAGVRAYGKSGDFIIGFSEKNKSLYNVAAINSPGLSSAPAIGIHVAQEIASKLGSKERTDFRPKRKAFDYFKNLTIEEKNAVIAAQPDFGKIVCRCENVSLGEIYEAMRTNPPAATLDAIKLRTRAGMGRCQSGFCQPLILKELAEKLNVDMDKVSKNGVFSEVLIGGEKWKKI